MTYPIRASYLTAVIAWLIMLTATDRVANAADSNKGVMEMTSDLALQKKAGSTPYHIVVTLDQPMKKDDIQNLENFNLIESDTNKNLTITRLDPAGVEDANGKLNQAVIYAQGLDAKASYEVVVHNPEVTPATTTQIAVDKPTDESGAIQEKYRNRFVSLTIAPLYSSQSQAVGLKFDTTITPFAATRDDWRFSLAADGDIVLSKDKKPASAPRNIDISLSANHNWYYDLANPLYKADGSGAGYSSHTYFYGVTLKPAELEADQSLDPLDLTSKGQFTASLPYTDLPVLWFNHQLGVSRYFFPMYLHTGYTYANRLKGSDVGFGGNNRWDTSLTYFIPLLDNVEAQLSWKGYYLIDDSRFKSFFEVTGRYYLDFDQNTALFLTYQKGTVAPNFDHDSSTILFGLQVGLGESKSTTP